MERSEFHTMQNDETFLRVNQSKNTINMAMKAKEAELLVEAEFAISS